MTTPRPTPSLPRARPWFGGALANLALGSLFAWSALSPAVADDLGLGDGALGVVFGVAIATFTAGVLHAGRRLQRWGARRTLRSAAALSAGGLVLPAVVPSLPALLLGIGGAFGLAGGLGYAAAVRVATAAAQRTTATGTVVAAYALGAVLAGPALDAAVGAVGWRWTLAVGGAVVAGLVAAGSTTVSDVTAAGAGGGPPRTRDVVLLWWAFAAASWPALHAFAHATAIAADRGLVEAATAVPALAAGNLGGRLAVAGAGERLRALDGLVVAVAGGVAGVAALGVLRPGAAFLAAAVAVGLAYGATSALVPLATAAVVGTEQTAATFGVVFTGWGLAGFAAPAVAGVLADASGGHRFGLALSTAVAATAIPAALALRRRA